MKVSTKINTIGGQEFSLSDSRTRAPIESPAEGGQPPVLGNLFRFLSLFRIRRQVPDGQSGPPGFNTTACLLQWPVNSSPLRVRKKRTVRKKALEWWAFFTP